MAPKPSKPRRAAQRRRPGERRKGQEYKYDVRNQYDQFRARTRVPPSPHARPLTPEGNRPVSGIFREKIFTTLTPVRGLEPFEITPSGVRIHEDRRSGKDRRKGRERRVGPAERRKSQQPVGHDHFDFNREWQLRNEAAMTDWLRHRATLDRAEQKRLSGSRFALQKGPASKGFGTVAHAIEASEPLHERNTALREAYLGSYLDRLTGKTAYFYVATKRA